MITSVGVCAVESECIPIGDEVSQVSHRNCKTKTFTKMVKNGEQMKVINCKVAFAESKWDTEFKKTLTVELDATSLANFLNLDSLYPHLKDMVTKHEYNGDRSSTRYPCMSGLSSMIRILGLS